ncbi:MAG TPA: hypothetical protein PKK15_04740 [Kouleothrix sp.]|nr:hypothetical protein [Kouleothrix sp.]
MPTITLALPDDETIDDTLIRLRAGARIVRESNDCYAVAAAPPAMPFAAGLIRSLISTDENDRIMAILVARVWLASHCMFCGAKLPDATFAFSEPAWCAACAADRDTGALARLGLYDEAVLEKDQISALLHDPNTSISEKAQLYLLAMGRELSQLARSGVREHGRGAIVLCIDASGGFSQAYYITDATVRRNGNTWPSDTIQQWVAEYDPNEQMVVIVQHQHGRSETYRMTLQEEPITPNLEVRRVSAA